MSLTDEAKASEQSSTIDRRRIKALETQVRARDAELSELKRLLDFTTAIDSAKVKPPKWLLPPKGKAGKRAIACAMLTDSHFQEVVAPAEVDWLNAYDDAIAEMRLRAFGTKAIEVGRDHLAGFDYDGFTLMWGGDIFTGTIHDELTETNSMPLYAAVVYWIENLLAVINQLVDFYGRVHNEVTYGNHGRDSKKPRGKGRAQHNIEWLLYRVLERETRHDPRITWHIPDSADTMFSIYSTRFTLTHGDQFRGGSGIAGALSPLLLGSHRKTRRAMASGRPYDVLVMGHFHQYLMLPGIVVGGTMKGTDEYSYLGNFGHQEPQQAFWLTTPERGITFPTPLYVMDRQAEGW